MRVSDTTAAGSLSAHELRCGRVQVATLVTEDGHEFQLRLSHNGSSYDVDLVPDEGPREWAPLPDGTKIVAGWAQFDNLTPARKFYRKILRSRNVAEAYAMCLAVMA